MSIEAHLVRTAPGLCGPKVVGGLTTRVGFPAGSGSSPEDARHDLREGLAAALSRSPESFAWCRQIHGGEVLRVEEPGLQGAADAMVCTDPSLGLLLTVADCLPVLLWDPRGKSFAVAHAGWRGLLAGVLPHTVEALIGLGAEAARLRAWIGPSICQEHFEVDEDVAARFPAECVVHQSEWSKPHVDLKALACAQLEEAGLTPSSSGTRNQQVSISPDCTYARQELYHSYRRDGGICGRHLAYLVRG